MEIGLSIHTSNQYNSKLKLMNKQLLLHMLQLAYSNQRSKAINELCLQIAVDPELNENLNIIDFSNEFYSVRSIRWIKQCFHFKLL
jgi:hypothetical protein